MFRNILRGVYRSTRFLVLSNPVPVKKFNLHISAISRMAKEFDKTELKKRLTPIQYQVTQEKGTERPFSGCYNKTYESGTYVCIVCEQSLFSSDTKYDSGCGWPAFNNVLDQGKVKLSPDTSGGCENRWSCRRDAGLRCSTMCYHCLGQACMNVESMEDDED